MSIFKPIQENEASGKVKEIYEDIKNKRQIKEVPNFWKNLANNPETLERTWHNLQQIMTEKYSNLAQTYNLEIHNLFLYYQQFYKLVD